MRRGSIIALVAFAVLFAVLELANAQQPGRGLTPVPGKPAAPDFTLTDSDDNIHKLSDYRGQVVVINFWATWCPPCRAEMPSMERAWTSLREQGVVLLGINVGEDADTLFEFTADYPVTFPLPMDSDSAVISAWPVRGLPTSFVVDTHGRIVYRAIGAREWDDPELIKQVLSLR